MTIMNFTKAQKSAIELRGRNILVSAAAGSGKTATLTERIIRLLTDKDNPADISRMLIVTFTRAAAGELRTRISKALSKSLANDPGNRHIAKQITTLGGAKISTIDSYYLDLVRSNFQRLDLPASFRLADETELLLLRSETMESVINRRYENDVEFIKYADQITTAKGEYKLSEQLLEIAYKLISLPEGTDYLKRCADDYYYSGKVDFFQCKIGKFMLNSISEEVEDMLKRCDRLIKLIDTDPSVAPYGNAISSDRDFLCQLSQSLLEECYEKSRNLIFDYNPANLGRVTKDSKSDTTEYVKDERNNIKSRIKEFKEKEFAALPEDIPEFCNITRAFCLKTKEVIDDYLEAYTNEKANRKICEFSDLRKYALQLLLNPDGSPTELAKIEQSNYDHIFVDEYQDTDSIQDKIFNTISNGKNLFFVGDIKQSIYSFRGAEPSVFSKYRRMYQSADAFDPATNEPVSVFMSENFRCSPNIIAFTNTVCSYLFRESEGNGGGIGYLAEDDLVASRQPPVSNSKVTVVLLEKSEESGAEVEYEYVIAEIRKLLREGQKPDGTPVFPGDIAILTRSNKEATKIADALAKAGIPRANSTGSDLFENPEVLLMLCLLSATDNPQRDIPLTGALRSPIFGFSMSDLVNLRVGRTNSSLYDSICEYAVSTDCDKVVQAKCIQAINKLNEYRRIAEAKPVHLFMRFLWSDVNALSYAGSDSHSKKRTPIERRRNLRKFYEYARRFESSSFKGLHEFIDFINGIIEKGTKITEEDAFTENTVRIMTVHKSKGLEFPIVFLTGTDKASNDQDARKPIVFTTNDGMGLACKVSDHSGSLQIDTPFRRTIANRISELSSDEEIRILYVALTRARDSLYVIASGKEGFAEKKISEAMKKAEIGGKFGIKSSSSWIDRILIALAAETVASSYEIEMPLTVKGVDVVSSDDSSINIDEEKVRLIYEQVKKSLDFKYPYDEIAEIPAKISVSKLYPELLDDDNDAESLAKKVQSLSTKKPRFMDDSDSAADKGTATHLFLQFCDFENMESTSQNITEEINRLVSQEFISEDIAKLIRVNEVVRFAQSNLFNSIKKASEVHRELRFNVFVPAREFTTDEALKIAYADHKILVQGVIDLCYFDEYGKLILCDYKTDRIPKEILNDPYEIKLMLEKAHKQQLAYYSYAIEKIFGRKPDKIYIYSLAYGDTFEIQI